ncbi:CDC42 small effector protein homolog [Microplitis demolitor]|uniref:CDC42 small effector protein homolog n=1 Tax=Microplitis demolitor TaxID=69319 RepID=UPI0004400247|nr:CDC42 small effector protein homolog [Microplitis demolitor]XP_008547548.1 CDC42 small effector protein homolog [Microplitis demolitor]
MANNSEVWVQWFTCCLTQRGTGSRNQNQSQSQNGAKGRQRQRLRIDRSMIGAPMNFQHTGHIGSGDLDMESAHLSVIQHQMQGKGGYEASFGVKAC